jgi:bifunctional non-homologous end joining protein LigD
VIGTRARSTRAAQRQPRADLPRWLQPQLCKLVKDAPSGPEWLHEIKFDGYRIHGRLDCGDIRLLTRKGLDWTHKYLAIAEALKTLPAF